jgi:hypothetical protein
MAGVMMEPRPEPQSEDPLQRLWDGVVDFQAKIEDLRIRATRDFRRPADAAMHNDGCGLKNTEARMPCSCCKGALTFDEAHFVKEKLTGVPAEPNPKARRFDNVPPTTCWGIENFRDLFGVLEIEIFRDLFSPVLALDLTAPNHSYGRLPWQDDSTLHYSCKSNEDYHAEMPSA